MAKQTVPPSGTRVNTTQKLLRLCPLPGTTTETGFIPPDPLEFDLLEELAEWTKEYTPSVIKAEFTWCDLWKPPKDLLSDVDRLLSGTDFRSIEAALNVLLRKGMNRFNTYHEKEQLCGLKRGALGKDQKYETDEAKEAHEIFLQLLGKSAFAYTVPVSHRSTIPKRGFRCHPTLKSQAQAICNDIGYDLSPFCIVMISDAIRSQPDCMFSAEHTAVSHGFYRRVRMQIRMCVGLFRAFDFLQPC